MSQDSYLDPYRDWARVHGSQFGVTLWASRQSQQKRFEVFAQLCDLTGKRILDAGCSRGDLAAFLIERGIAFEQYIGIDGLDEVITYAKQRDLPRCRFLLSDFVAEPQVLGSGNPQIICISGSLNTMTDDQTMSALESAWQAASETLIFNFLSDRSGVGAVSQDQPARRQDTIKLLDWALGKTPLVRFDQTYFPQGHDATVLMTKAKD